MRTDQWSETLILDGEPLGVWDTFEGGEGDSEETTYRPGGMGAAVSLGGPTTVGAITLGRLLVLERDWELVKFLMSRRGKGDCSVSRQPLDTDGNPWGEPLVYRGTLKTVTPPGSDSNSSDPALYTIVITPEGDVA